jgi:hypothetical protein
MKILILLFLVGCSTLVNQNALKHSNKIIAGQSVGSGSYLDLGSNRKGLFLTNAHVCQDHKNVLVGKDKGVVVKLDKKSDLCLVQTGNLKKGLKLANSYSVGEDVTISHNKNLPGLIKTSIVSNKTMTIERIYRDGDYCSGKIVDYRPLLLEYYKKLLDAGVSRQEALMQIKMATLQLEGELIRCKERYKRIVLSREALPGMSGSPVLNSSGQIVAVVNMSGGEAHSLAIPLEAIKEFLK